MVSAIWKLKYTTTSGTIPGWREERLLSSDVLTLASGHTCELRNNWDSLQGPLTSARD